MAMANMAGQLMVWGPETKLKNKMRSKRSARMEIGDAQGTGSFLGKPWDEAVSAFRARGVMDENELSRLLKDYANQSVEARSLMLDRIQERVHTMLGDAIEQGQTMEQFATGLRAEADGLGITATDPSYLDMVFRTNVQSAYGAGRYLAMTDPDVMDARPYVQYRTAGDARVRPEHEMLDGLTFAMDNPTWHRIAPPNGFNCRCSIVTMSAEEAAGEEVSEDLPDGYEPDPDFDGPPI